MVMAILKGLLKTKPEKREIIYYACKIAVAGRFQNEKFYLVYCYIYLWFWV